ncbi:transcription initiation factor tfiid subunit [Anaeramoeba flamelloides]|uniref:Transcription initiation factor tfiid subunit n=1 Tax=Anaeramoeba flamelloides TaxID=1746091 RepID=A0AAV7ZJB2_9EUKA|nr:transcription initiation factor tfiid subunit [Anaeramoeba flamelloides]
MLESNELFDFPVPLYQPDQTVNHNLSLPSTYILGEDDNGEPVLKLTDLLCPTLMNKELIGNRRRFLLLGRHLQVKKKIRSESKIQSQTAPDEERKFLSQVVLVSESESSESEKENDLSLSNTIEPVIFKPTSPIIKEKSIDNLHNEEEQESKEDKEQNDESDLNNSRGDKDMDINMNTNQIKNKNESKMQQDEDLQNLGVYGKRKKKKKEKQTKQNLLFKKPFLNPKHYLSPMSSAVFHPVEHLNWEKEIVWDDQQSKDTRNVIQDNLIPFNKELQKIKFKNNQFTVQNNFLQTLSDLEIVPNFKQNRNNGHSNDEQKEKEKEKEKEKGKQKQNNKEIEIEIEIEKENYSDTDNNSDSESEHSTKEQYEQDFRSFVYRPNMSIEKKIQDQPTIISGTTREEIEKKEKILAKCIKKKAEESTQIWSKFLNLDVLNFDNSKLYSSIIWSNSESKGKNTEALSLDLNDENILFEKRVGSNPIIFPLKEDFEIQFIKKQKRINFSKSRINQRATLPSDPFLSREAILYEPWRRYNVSHDLFYSNPLQKFNEQNVEGKLSLIHSEPALRLIGVKETWSTKDLRSFHRPEIPKKFFSREFPLFKQGMLDLDIISSYGNKKTNRSKMKKKKNKYKSSSSEKKKKKKKKKQKKRDRERERERKRKKRKEKKRKRSKFRSEKFGIGSSSSHRNNNKLREESLPAERFQTVSDLSIKEGSFVLFEYMEERPIIVQNFGMVSKIVTYYVKKNVNDTGYHDDESNENTDSKKNRSDFGVGTHYRFKEFQKGSSSNLRYMPKPLNDKRYKMIFGDQDSNSSSDNADENENLIELKSDNLNDGNSQDPKIDTMNDHDHENNSNNDNDEDYDHENNSNNNNDYDDDDDDDDYDDFDDDDESNSRKRRKYKGDFKQNKKRRRNNKRGSSKKNRRKRKKRRRRKRRKDKFLEKDLENRRMNQSRRKNRKQNLWKKKSNEKLEINEIKEELKKEHLIIQEHTDPSVFISALPLSTKIKSVQNKLFRAPIAQHEAPETDFIVCRAFDGAFYIREIPAIYTVGKTQALQEVYGPKSKKTKKMQELRLKVFLYRFLKKNNLRSIRARQVQEMHPLLSDTFIRKSLSGFLEFQKTGKKFGSWIFDPKNCPLTEKEAQELVTPEMICLFESMLAGQQYLLDRGVSSIYSLNIFSQMSLKILNNQVKEGIQILKDLLRFTPWEVSNHHISESKGKQVPFRDVYGKIGYIKQSKKSKQGIKKKKKKRESHKPLEGTQSDLRKLKLPELRQIASKFFSSSLIEKQSRWDLVHLIREKCNELDKRGEESSLTRFARNKTNQSKEQQKYSKCRQNFFNRMLNRMMYGDPLTGIEYTIPSDEEDKENENLINNNINNNNSENVNTSNSLINNNDQNNKNEQLKNVKIGNDNSRSGSNNDNSNDNSNDNKSTLLNNQSNSQNSANSGPHNQIMDMFEQELQGMMIEKKLQDEIDPTEITDVLKLEEVTKPHFTNTQLVVEIVKLKFEKDGNFEITPKRITDPELMKKYISEKKKRVGGLYLNEEEGYQRIENQKKKRKLQDRKRRILKKKEQDEKEKKKQANLKKNDDSSVINFSNGKLQLNVSSIIDQEQLNKQKNSKNKNKSSSSKRRSKKIIKSKKNKKSKRRSEEYDYSNLNSD